MSQEPTYTADICDQAPEARVMELAFVDYTAVRHFEGEVVTFATFEDNAGLRELLAAGGEGKVLVVDGRGSRRRALCGGNVAALAQEHRWAGIVIHGCIRDQHEMTGLGLGLKAIGSTPVPPRHDGIGRAGVALGFGGVTVHPGDYLYADPDGVVLTASRLS